MVCVSTSTAAQSPTFQEAVFVEPLSPAQERELDGWLARMEAWQRYATKYDNRPARDVLGRIADRRQPPEAPGWLAVYCADAGAVGLTLADQRTVLACRLLEDPRASAEALSARVQAARLAAEQPARYRSFLRRVHLDGLWISTSTGPQAYGIVGSHITLVDVGRVQVFGPPGVLLISLPDLGGGRRVTLGYTWGMSVRLADVRLGSASGMTLFLTMSKAWVGGGSFQVAGLSLAPRKE
jgi:hypothetical protein